MAESTNLVHKEIRRFLSSTEPEVLCIRGTWGVGKTFAWRTLLEHAHRNDAIALKSYAYVSLFGIDSLEQLRYAIFENSVRVEEIGIEPTVATAWTNTTSVLKQIGRRSLPLLSNDRRYGFPSRSGEGIECTILQ